MFKNFCRFFLRLSIFFIVLALLHWGLVHFTPLSLAWDELFGMHIFLLIITLLVFLAITWVWKQHFDKVGFAFLASVMLKMAAAMLYLLPWLREGGDYAENLIFHFMAVYFAYLFMETLEVLKLMRKEASEAAGTEGK